MQHLNEEQLVAFHYRDDDAPAAASQHLGGCAECAKQYDVLRRVLALVDEAPVPERGEGYGEEVWKRLRWKLGSRERRRRWQSLIALAAMLAVAFVTGLLWRSRPDAPSVPAIATTTAAPAITPAASGDAPGKLLFVVVNDHLDTSGRMLLEVANASPDTQLASQPRRAGDLVAANRIYRQTAQQRGDERIAQLLTELEPILLELANAGDSLEGKQLADLQKRIESKGLLFKVRVMSAPSDATEFARPGNVTTDSL
ncbi:MAG TPA: hypothetical protein VFT12_04450 [Thermoanaerobaculia bacterium]|nr:hypothetical protein [Thermoanaerobaculia bacterium]